MPRVCHISTMTGWGGVERMLVDLLTKAPPSRFDHSLLTTSSHIDVMRPIYESKVESFEPKKLTRYDPNAIRQMAKWLRKNRIDVVHAYNSTASAWGAIAVTLAKTPILVGGEHGTVWSVRPPLSWLNRWAYSRAKVVVANSRAAQKMLQHRFGISSQKTRIVYNAIPAYDELRNPLRLKELIPLRGNSQIIIGSIGRLVPEKSYHILVESAALVLQKQSNIHFVLVGGGEQENQLRTLIRKYGIEDQFTLTGWRADARALMQGFDIFVNTSVRESFGNVLVEAGMACLPVIAPRIDGIPEAVVDKSTGILITPTVPIPENERRRSGLPNKVVVDGRLSEPVAVEPSRVAEAILLLANSPTLRDMYGDAGRQRANERFTLERYQRELEDVYASCLA